MQTALGPQFTYSTSPIDFWDGWLPMSEFVRQLVGREMSKTAPFRVSDFLKFLLAGAHRIAHKDGAFWEGDVRGGFGHATDEGYEENMYVALPNGEFPRSLSELAIGWKQDNNGETYIVSSRPLSIEDEQYDASAPKL